MKAIEMVYNVSFFPLLKAPLVQWLKSVLVDGRVQTVYKCLRCGENYFCEDRKES